MTIAVAEAEVIMTIAIAEAEVIMTIAVAAGAVITRTRMITAQAIGGPIPAARPKRSPRSGVK